MAIVSSKPSSDPERSPQSPPTKPAPAKTVSPAPSASILQPEAAQEERNNKQDEKLRPQRLDEYIGQRELKEVLKISIQAAQSRQEPLDHLLLYGPPGLGENDHFPHSGYRNGRQL